MLEYD